MPQIDVKGRRIEHVWIEGDPALPTLVFLHEGLGSIRLWRDFPQRVARATSCRALVYDRYGYGDSDMAQQGGDELHGRLLRHTRPPLLGPARIVANPSRVPQECALADGRL